MPHGNMTFNAAVLRRVLRLLVPPTPTPSELAAPREATSHVSEAAQAAQAAEAAPASEHRSPFVCESDLTATDRDATCLHVECNAIRKAICVDGRCQCPPGRCGRDSPNRSLLPTAARATHQTHTRPDPRCSDMGDPHAPFGVSVGAQTQATRGAPHMARPIVR